MKVEYIDEHFFHRILIFAESEIEPLPDVALGSAVSESVAAEELEAAAEELSSDFAQPTITKPMIPRKISKLVKFFILTSLNNKS